YLESRVRFADLPTAALARPARLSSVGDREQFVSEALKLLRALPPPTREPDQAGERHSCAAEQEGQGAGEDLREAHRARHTATDRDRARREDHRGTRRHQAARLPAHRAHSQAMAGGSGFEQNLQVPVAPRAEAAVALQLAARAEEVATTH